MRVVLTDIEGTTSSIGFVHDVLFPYARDRLAAFVEAHASAPEVASCLADAAREGALEAASRDEIVGLLLRWIDEDRKARPLKTLQGLIWEAGYRDGSLVADVYDDALAALRRWHAEGRALYVYSSGSVHAQRLLFAHTAAGDLTPLFSGYFDTTVGGKREAASYRRIAEAIGAEPGDIVFLSDIEAELDAAREVGMETVWVQREERAASDVHRVVTGFAEID